MGGAGWGLGWGGGEIDARNGAGRGCLESVLVEPTVPSEHMYVEASPMPPTAFGPVSPPSGVSPFPPVAPPTVEAFTPATGSGAAPGLPEDAVRSPGTLGPLAEQVAAQAAATAVLQEQLKAVLAEARWLRLEQQSAQPGRCSLPHPDF